MKMDRRPLLMHNIKVQTVMDIENLLLIVTWEEAADASWNKDSAIRLITNLTLE